MNEQVKSLYTPVTLCEVCENACGGGDCPWAECGVQQPVPGWTAIRRDLNGSLGEGTVESYVVLECPLFVVEEKNRWAYKKFNPAAVRRMMRHRDSAGDHPIKNSRRGRVLSVNGETKTVYQWCTVLRISHSSIYEWIRERGVEYAEARIAAKLKEAAK